MVFAANFFVVCHCQASMKAQMAHAGMHAMSHHSGAHSCCERMHRNALTDETVDAGAVGAKRQATAKSGAADGRPCDGNGCTHRQAVRFQLLEKQVAEQVTQPAVFVSFVINPFILDSVAARSLIDGSRVRIDRWPGTYSPPDLLALYQSFLI